MEPPSSFVVEFQSIVVIATLFLVNALFVAVESAVIRSHASRLRAPEAQKMWGAKAALALLERSELTLSSTQLGITATTVFLGWFGLGIAEKAAFSLTPVLGTGASSLPYFATLFLSAGLLIWLHVVVGEILGKAVAIRYPEQTLCVLAPAMRWFMRMAQPLIWFIHLSGTFLTRLLQMKNPSAFGRVGSSGELAALIAQSSEEGVLDEEEKEMLHGIIGFSETVAREIMTPRTDLVTVPLSASKSELVSIITQSGLSRFPVIGESTDHVEGVILARDAIGVIASDKPFSLKEIVREPYFIPGTKPIDDLLNEFKHRKLHMAIVLDEHGGVDGVVTLEDIIEEIVGEIYDESDVAEVNMVVTAEGDILLDGGLHIADVNEELEFNIPEGDYDTIGGFVFSALGRIPNLGDSILLTKNGIPLIRTQQGVVHSEATDAEASEEEGIVSDFDEAIAQITVDAIDGNRIERLRVSMLTPQHSEPLAA